MTEIEGLEPSARVTTGLGAALFLVCFLQEVEELERKNRDVNLKLSRLQDENSSLRDGFQVRSAIQLRHDILFLQL